jgi:hypothetical protein
VRRDRPHHAELLEHAHDLVVQRESARELVHTAPPVAYVHAQAGLAQERGSHSARRAEADDGDVVRRGVRRHVASASIGLCSVPIRSMTTSTLSPAFIQTGGVRD